MLAFTVGLCSTTNQRLVNIVVRDADSDNTLLHCRAPQATTFKVLQGGLFVGRK